MLPPEGSRPRKPLAGILVYGMYDMSALDRAPTVRIALMTAALSRRLHTETITGGRFGRFAASVRWLASGGPRRVGAVYVESATTSAMPTDLAFLALMRLLGKPVGVYFRDAYQLFRDTYPRRSRRQVLSDALWRLTTPLLRGVAGRHYAPSTGLAEALRLHDPVVLRPGTDPTQPDLGSGKEPIVAYVGATNRADGFDLLLEAMAAVHATLPDARLELVGAPPAVDLPEYAGTRRAARDGLADALRPARLCVIPRPINAYSNLAVPIKLWDYLSLGKPVVATAATETAEILSVSGAGIATPGTAEGLAAGLLRLLSDDAEAARMAAAARTFACAPTSTWDDRARIVIETLGTAQEAGSTDRTASNG
jgi:glycosyltransferase involved in cell wall biosynthesis